MLPTWSRPLAAGVALPALLAITGCIGKSTLSSAARNGDTVMIAFGWEDTAGNLRREDLSAQIKDSNNNERAVKIRAVINVYADPTSPVGAEKADPFDALGLRAAVIDLVDPSTGVPTTLAPGAAKLTLRRLADQAVIAADIEIAILPGTGSPNPLQEQTFGGTYIEALQPRPQVRYWIRPIATGYNQPLGAVEFEVRFPASALNGRPETSWPQAIHTAADQHLRFSTRYFQDGTQQVIKVLMINPNGLLNTGVSAAAGYRGTSLYSSMRFAVAWGTALRETSYPPDSFNRNTILNGPTSFRVFDIAGADVTGNFRLVKE